MWIAEARCSAGQLLAELENQDLAGAVTENQGGYQQAEANYQTAVQNATQNLKLAKQQLDAQQKIYDSRVGSLEQGAVSAKEVEDAKNQFDAGAKPIRSRAKTVRPESRRGAIDGGEREELKRRGAAKLHEDDKPH